MAHPSGIVKTVHVYTKFSIPVLFDTMDAQRKIFTMLPKRKGENRLDLVQLNKLAQMGIYGSIFRLQDVPDCVQYS